MQGNVLLCFRKRLFSSGRRPVVREPTKPIYDYRPIFVMNYHLIFPNRFLLGGFRHEKFLSQELSGPHGERLRCQPTTGRLSIHACRANRGNHPAPAGTE
jgi:hypothetical protein